MNDRFDERDPELGARLKEVFDLTDDEAFAKRVVDAAVAKGMFDRQVEWWEVLGNWARPGLAAAAALAVIGLGVWLRTRDGDPEARLVADLAAGDEIEVLAEVTPPDPEELLAIAFREIGQ